MELQALYKQFCNIARIVQFELCQKFGLVVEVKWYNHKPASVVENDRIKMLRDFDIQKDHVIQHRRSDPNVLYKIQRKCHLIDIALPGDKRIELKEQQQIGNYTELRREVKKIWNLTQAVAVAIVIGAVGVTSKKLKDWLKNLDVKSSKELLKKAALFGTAKIVRQVLET